MSVYWFSHFCNVKCSGFFKQNPSLVSKMQEKQVIFVSVLPEAYLFIIRIIILQCINFRLCHSADISFYSMWQDLVLVFH